MLVSMFRKLGQLSTRQEYHSTPLHPQPLNLLLSRLFQSLLASTPGIRIQSIYLIQSAPRACREAKPSQLNSYRLRYLILQHHAVRSASRVQEQRDCNLQRRGHVAYLMVKL
jgi:hypothetical protein